MTAAAAAGARLIVLPELATSGYVFRDQDEARGAAMTRGDARWSMIQDALPADAVAVVGYCERDGSELFNTAAVLMRTTRIGDYRKSHLWGAERTIFESGDPPVRCSTQWQVVSGSICYDNEFPEVPRKIALAGAELLALPVNWPAVPRPQGERPPETIQAMAAARSSRLATVIADRSGTERGVEWTAGTTIIDEDGWIAAEPADGAAIATSRFARWVTSPFLRTTTCSSTAAQTSTDNPPERIIMTIADTPPQVRPPRGIEVKSIDWVPLDARRGKPSSLFPLWLMSNANLTTLATGMVGAALGANFATSVLAILTGVAVGTIFTAFHSAQGPSSACRR